MPEAPEAALSVRMSPVAPAKPLLSARDRLRASKSPSFSGAGVSLVGSSAYGSDSGSPVSDVVSESLQSGMSASGAAGASGCSGGASAAAGGGGSPS